MRKLKFPFLLGMLQLAVAVILDVWASREVPPVGLDTLYAPTGSLVSRGINAPAWLVERILTFPIPARVNKAPITILGVGLHEYFFLLLVFALWFLMGAVAKQVWNRNTHCVTLYRSWPVVVSMTLLGAALFALGLFRVSRPFDLNNPVGNTIEGALFILWGLAIGLIALLRGRNLRRQSHASSAASP